MMDWIDKHCRASHNDPGATNVAQIVIAGTKRQGAISMPAFGNAYSDARHFGPGPCT
jgi:hypothetical protein